MRACFNGCSFTVGEGFPPDLRDQYIYDRLISKTFNFSWHNIAKGGSSNYLIFLRSASSIISKQYDIVFNQWSALNRLWLFPGPDTEYSINSERFIFSTGKQENYKYRDICLSNKEKTNLDNILLCLNQDYQNIIDLIDYCIILDQLAKYNSVKIVHINGLVPWTQELNTYQESKDLKSQLSSYTQSILDFDHRDDNEIIKFFKKLQDKFCELDQTAWVNIFDSFHKNTIDKGPEGHHPGVQSHRWMADQVINYINESKIL